MELRSAYSQKHGRVIRLNGPGLRPCPSQPLFAYQLALLLVVPGGHKIPKLPGDERAENKHDRAAYVGVCSESPPGGVAGALAGAYTSTRTVSRHVRVEFKKKLGMSPIFKFKRLWKLQLKMKLAGACWKFAHLCSQSTLVCCHGSDCPYLPTSSHGTKPPGYSAVAGDSCARVRVLALPAIETRLTVFCFHCRMSTIQ